MTNGFLRRRRSGAQKAVLSTVAAWVVVISAVATGLIAYLAAATLTGVRDTVSTAAPTDRTTQVSTRLHTDDPAQQDATIRATVQRLLPDVDVTISRSLSADPGGLDTEEAGGRGVLVAFDGIADYAELTAGTWPSDDATSETAVHAAAAESLEIGVGDSVTVGDRELAVTGTWLPTDPADPYWYGNPLETTGIDGSAYGPFVVEEAALTADGAVPLARWRVTPVASALVPSHLSELAAALPRLDTILDGDAAFDVRGVVVTNGLAATATELAGDVDRSQSISLVPLVVLAAVGLVAGIQVARLLAAVRQDETTLFRSRGATPGQLVRWSAIEAVLIAVPSAAAGAAAAGLALRFGVDAAIEPVPMAVTAAVVGLVAVAVLVAMAAQTAQQKVEESVAAASRRASGAIGWSLTLGALIAAGVTIWQLRQYGSGRVAGGADLLATPGPALALLGLAALALAILPVPLAMAERRLAKRRGLGMLLPAWEVSRRLPSYAAVIVLVAVTTGTGILAAAYAATWTGLQEDLAHSRTGADVRAMVNVLGPLNTGRPPTPVDRFGDVPGVSSAVPGNTASARVGEAPATLLALPADRTETVMTVRADLFPVDGIAEQLVPAGEPGLIPLPEETTAIEVMTTPGVAAEVILADPHGALAYRSVVGGVAEVPEGFTASGILAVQLVEAATDAESGPLAPAAVTAIGVVTGSGARTELDIAATAQSWRPVSEEFTPGPNPLSLAEPLPAGARLRFAPMPLADAQVPAVLTHELMSASGLEVGDSFTTQAFGTRLDMVVAAAADVIPGVDDATAMVVDLATINTAVVAGAGSRPQGVNQVWISAPSPSDAAGSVRQAKLGTASVVDAESVRDALVEQGLARQAVFAFWSVALAAIVLTAIGTLASTATSNRQRRGELAVLRVVGVTPGDQARSRRTEQISMSAVAMVVGAAGGVVLAALTAGVLALAATSGVPGALEPVGRWSAPLLGAFVVVLVATVVAVTWSYASRVGKEASIALPGSERR